MFFIATSNCSGGNSTGSFESIRWNVWKYMHMIGILLLKPSRFLLAQLHMDSLNSQPTIGHIKKALKILPRGMKGLDATYKEAMARIDGQVEGLRNLARRVLSWVTHARSVLRVDALAMALAIEENTTKLDL